MSGIHVTDDASEIDSDMMLEIKRQKQVFQDMKHLLLAQQMELKKNVQCLTVLSQKGMQFPIDRPNAAAAVNRSEERKDSFHSVHLEDEFEALRVWGTPRPSIQERSSGSLTDQEASRSSATLKPLATGVWASVQLDRSKPSNQGANNPTHVLPPNESISPPEDVGPGEDKICPVCGAMFYRPCPFEAYENHVISHFDDEESILSQFEVVTQNL